ncbi:DUF1109 domain-containing protein [Pantoea septica]|uniref:DUF1109 domain-containing protein n=1 Tax=Pantoea septica TaxID=472695 RepID=UPI001C0F4555|nr:DUF1109 domain-containing protein [Pantoea septica]MBU5379647.1 DUF1109 domain-containing protein [Pantoea septica]MDU5836465.1 DUF1109 domain-containing protein [Pantoea sp.]
MRNHDQLIEQLSASAQPVRRVWPTAWRVTGWIAAALPCGALGSWALHSRYTDWSQPGAPLAIAALLLSFMLGVGAIAGAFTLSLAGRKPPALRYLLLPALAWLALNLGNMTAAQVPAGAGRFGEGIHCYLFMLCAGLPMMAISVFSLYRTRSLFPAKSLALAGCGIAFMSSMLLSLCHDTQLHMIDFLMHLAAGLTLVALTVATGRRWVRLEGDARI